MKKKDRAEIGQKSPVELKKLSAELRLDLGKLSLEQKLAKTKNVRMARLKRKEIAQILTILRQKELVEKFEKVK